MNRNRKEWAAVKPDAFLDGSIVQARNIIEMMQQDIDRLYRNIAELEAVLSPFGKTEIWSHIDSDLCVVSGSEYGVNVIADDFRHAHAALRGRS